jgi:hypothetical protein
MPRTIRFRELTNAISPDARVDEQSGVIRSVRLIGPVSANGRRYTSKCLADAAPMYDGVFAYANHRHGNEDRKVEDKVGWYKNVHQTKDGGLSADMYVLKSHPMAPRIFEAASRNPRMFMLSHDATGTEQDGSDGTVIESLQAIHSVDLVTEGATVSSLYESLMKCSPKRECAMAGKTGGPDGMSAITGPGGTDGPAGYGGVMDHGKGVMTRIMNIVNVSLGAADSKALDADYLSDLQDIADICDKYTGDDDDTSDAPGDDGMIANPDEVMDDSSQESRSFWSKHPGANSVPRGVKAFMERLAKADRQKPKPKPAAPVREARPPESGVPPTVEAFLARLNRAARSRSWRMP